VQMPGEVGCPGDGGLLGCVLFDPQATYKEMYAPDRSCLPNSLRLGSILSLLWPVLYTLNTSFYSEQCVSYNCNAPTNG